MAEAFREFVITRRPTDLLDHLDVTIVDGDLRIGRSRPPGRVAATDFARAGSASWS